MLTNVGGGGAPAAAAAVGGGAAAGGAAAAEEAPKEEKKEEAKEESDDDMVCFLYDSVLSCNANTRTRASVCSTRFPVCYNLLVSFRARKKNLVSHHSVDDTLVTSLLPTGKLERHG